MYDVELLRLAAFPHAPAATRPPEPPWIRRHRSARLPAKLEGFSGKFRPLQLKNPLAGYHKSHIDQETGRLMVRELLPVLRNASNRPHGATATCSRQGEG